MTHLFKFLTAGPLFTGMCCSISFSFFSLFSHSPFSFSLLYTKLHVHTADGLQKYSTEPHRSLFSLPFGSLLYPIKLNPFPPLFLGYFHPTLICFDIFHCAPKYFENFHRTPISINLTVIFNGTV